MEQPDVITADQLITEIIECAKRIRRQLGPGFLEKVYKNAMVVELRKLKLKGSTPLLLYLKKIMLLSELCSHVTMSSIPPRFYCPTLSCLIKSILCTR